MRILIQIALASLLVALAACAVDGDAALPDDEAELAVETSRTAPAAAENAAAPSDEALQLSADDVWALDTFGQQCGSVVCTGKTHCCNASCNRCAPLGVECPQVACVGGSTTE